MQCSVEPCSQPSFSLLTLAYGQVQDVRGLKAIVWCGCQFSWPAVIHEIRKILKNLPLTAANITAASDALIEGLLAHLNDI